MHVIVIGGGFAGIAAAMRLAEHGVRVTLLEARETLGGRARSDALDGMAIDTGAQLITSAFARTMHVLQQAPSAAQADADPDVAAARLRRTSGRDVMLLDGAREPLHFGSLTSLMAFRGLGIGEKLRLGRHLLPILTRERHRLSASGEDTPATLDAQTARAFVVEHVGAHAADILVEPPLNPFYALRGDEASLAFHLTLARYGSEGDVLAPVGGWSRLLARALAGAPHIQVVSRAQGERLVERGSGVRVEASDGRSWEGDGAVVATGPRAAHALLASLHPAPETVLHWLRDVPLRRTWTAAFVVSSELPRDAFGIFQPPAASAVVSACAVHGAKLGDAAPAGRDVLLAWPTPELAQQMIDAPATEIAEVMQPAVEGMIPESRGRIQRARVYRTDEGTVIPGPGWGAARARGQALSRALALPVRLAGDYLAFPFIEGAVASGERAADELLAAAVGT